MAENKILPEGFKIPDQTRQNQIWKGVLLGFFAIIGFGATWKLFELALIGHNPWFWLYAGITASIGVSFLTFLAIVNVGPYLFWGTNFLILALYLLLLPHQPAVLIGGLLFFVFAYWFERQVRDDEHSRADFSLTRILRSSINLMVYALLLVIGFNLYNLIKIDFQNNPDAVYDKIGHYAAEGLNYIPQGFGNFNPNQNFNDFVTQQAQNQEPGFNQAPKSAQDILIQEFKDELEKKFNIQVDGNPLLGDVVAGAVAEKVKDVSANYSRFFPAIFAFLVVIILRYAGFLFAWMTELVAWLIYRLLRALKFFRIEKVQVEVDKLQI